MKAARIQGTQYFHELHKKLNTDAKFHLWLPVCVFTKQVVVFSPLFFFLAFHILE